MPNWLRIGINSYRCFPFLPQQIEPRGRYTCPQYNSRSTLWPLVWESFFSVHAQYTLMIHSRSYSSARNLASQYSVQVPFDFA